MNATKKILLVNPYLDSAGGGERHVLSMLKVCEAHGYSIDIAWKDSNVLEQLKQRLGMSFKKVNVVTDFHSATPLKRALMTKKYDSVLYVTDGSYFVSLARQTFVFIMYPKKEFFAKGLINKLKQTRIRYIANSPFTYEKIRGWTNKPIDVIEPFISDDFFALYGPKRQKIILSVGRFFRGLHDKRQDVLIDAFRQLKRKNRDYRQYKLILVGGMKDEDKSYVSEIKRDIRKRNDIELVLNPSYEKLLEYYKKAPIYWHAAGYGFDEDEHPEKVEHLGITPLEAMAAGAVTICYNNGGPKKYLSHGRNGFLYTSDDDLVRLMGTLPTDKHIWEAIRKKAVETVKEEFSYEAFERKVVEVFNLSKT